MNKDKSEHLKSFDYLKSISILMILVTHLGFSVISRKNLLFPYWIDMAVPFFFIVNGYMYSLSWEKRNLKSIKDWFKYKNFSDKFLRILVPYVIIFLLEVLLYKILNRDISSREIVNGFITGGWGPGSYYFPVLIQLLLLFPFILSIAKKKNGWIILILIQVLLEITTQKLGLSDGLYRLLFFRYLGFVTFGILLYFRDIKGNDIHILKIFGNRFLLLGIFLCGVGLIYMLSYTSYEPLIFKRWTTTSLPTLLYSFPLVFVFTKAESLLQRVPKILNNIIILIAKSTYHIFLVQMTYYWFRVQDSGRLRESLLESLFICIPLGILFYFVESNLTRKLFKRK